jgi:5-methylcytosine-specific restriction endonuclease McrA
MFGFFSLGMIEAIDLCRPIGRVVRNKRNKRRWHQRIYWRDNGVCQYCHKAIPYDQSTLDHIKPLVAGGKDSCKENMALACEECNRLKGPLEMDESQRADLSIEMLKVRWASLDKVIR